MKKPVYSGEHKRVKYQQLKYKNTWCINFDDCKMNVLSPISEEDLKKFIDTMQRANKILNRV
jgi:hypothetical protein